MPRNRGQYGRAPGRFTRTHRGLQAQFTVRAEANQLQGVRVWLALDEDQVGLDVAVPMVVPFAAERMVDVPLRQRLVGTRSSKTVSRSIANEALCCPLFSRLKSRLKLVVHSICRIEFAQQLAHAASPA